MSDIIRPTEKPAQSSVDYSGDSAEPAVKTGQPRVFKAIMQVEHAPGKHRVTIKKAGWEGFTGEFGGHRFKNGVSLDLLTEVTCDRIAAIIPCEDENGVTLGYTNRLHRLRAINPDIPNAHVSRTLADVLNEEDKSPEDALKEEADRVKSGVIDEALKDNPQLSYDQLLAVADKDGIAGLREIAEPYGVRGRAIPDLIAAILRAQVIVSGGDPSSVMIPDPTGIIETA